MKRRIIDKRVKEKYLMDDAYLNGYASLCGWKATLVYMSLCRHADKEQSCFPSIGLMAREHNVSRDTIMDGIKVLTVWSIVQVRRSKAKNGVWKNNTYVLLDKSEWRAKPHHVANSNLDNVANSNYGSSQQQLDQVAGSDTKDTHTEGNTNKVIAEASSAPWSFNSFKEKLENSDHRYLNIIALYWDYKQPQLTNEQQAQNELKRLVRAAKQLEPYEDGRLIATMDWLKGNANFKWTLETVLKHITEDLSKLKPYSHA